MMIERLCSEIEVALQRKMRTPKDFEFLHGYIFTHRHQFVSTTTLKRVWGYVAEDVQPRIGTLDILARLLCYRDWESYCAGSRSEELPSAPAMGKQLSVGAGLSVGDRIRLTWQPGRVCDVEYMGNSKFRVVASQNTRLRAGNTFRCSLIIEGEPLYIDRLQQENLPPIAYVCGKRQGVMFEIL